MENLRQLNPCFDFSGFTLILEIQRNRKMIDLASLQRLCMNTSIRIHLPEHVPEKMCC